MPVNEFNQPIGEPVIDWQPCAHPQRITLTGERCRLEPPGASWNGTRRHTLAGLCSSA